MENPTNNKEKELRYKRLADSLMAKLSALTSSKCEVRIGKVLGDLELAPIFGIRRTFSQDAMLKAYLLLRLKNIKSFRALVNYLKNRPGEASNIGFDKNENGVIIPSQQDIWHFAKTLDKEGLALVDFIVTTIKRAAEKFNLVLDPEPAKLVVAEDVKSKKTFYNHKNNKSRELVSFVKERLKKKLKFKLRHNAIFKNEELLDLLIWIAYEQNFAESGSGLFSEMTNKRIPNADTLFYHLKKFKIEEVREIFTELFELTFRTAKQQRIISGRTVDVAIDATSWLFYGDPSNYGVTGTKPERGTCWAYKFLTLDIVNNGQRFTLFALPYLPGDNQTELVGKLLTYAKARVSIGKVFLDRGFFSSDCINLLDKMHLKYIMPAKLNANVVKRVSGLSAPRIYPKCSMKTARFNLVVLESDGNKHYFATNIPLTSDDLIMAFRIGEMYRSRWQIETGYRIKKYIFRGKTTSVNYMIRYFYFMLSTALYNCWLLVDLGVRLCLGLATRTTQITAKRFAVALLNIGKDPNG